MRGAPDPAARRTLLALLLLGGAVWLPTLANGFVYDDVAVIVERPLLHSLGPPGAVWQASYWAAGNLYRPLTLQLFALEWAVGGGAAWPFHAVNVLLALAGIGVFLRLARRLLPPMAAAFASAVYAVHPVHVEVVANGVGQSELLVSLFAFIAVERFLAWREGGALDLGRRLALLGLVAAAVAAKETGYVVPVLFAAAALTLSAGTAPRRSQLAALSIGCAAVVVGSLTVRWLVLGSLAGETAAAPLRGLGPVERTQAMLAVVPEWARLLVWPARLQGEYGPPGLAVSPDPGPAHLIGAVLLLAGAALLIRSLRRDPVLAFGLLWIAVALVPVSNTVVPTGLVLAERTLFLPSAGFALVLGSGARLLVEASAAGPPMARPLTALVLAVPIAFGAARSILRVPVWHDQDRFFTRLVEDAPAVYRAHHSAGVHWFRTGRFELAEPALVRALELYRGDPRVYEELGQLRRVAGRCDTALPVLREGIERHPDRTLIRSRYVECALAVGDTAAARAAADAGIRRGNEEFRAVRERLDRRASSAPEGG